MPLFVFIRSPKGHCEIIFLKLYIVQVFKTHLHVVNAFTGYFFLNIPYCVCMSQCYMLLKRNTNALLCDGTKLDKENPH